MFRRRLTGSLSSLIVLLGLGEASAQERALLNSVQPSEELSAICTHIRHTTREKVPYDHLTRTTSYFVRIAPRKVILTESGDLREDAILGTRSLVFLTTPESIYGKSLLEIYEDIGYEAEDIIRWQRDEDMVAILFRYPVGISLSGVLDGQLPQQWSNWVYTPTWDNMYALLERLAENATIEPQKRGEFAPERTFFRSEAERMFVLGFPERGKERIKKVPYAELKAIGGADWVYRSLLESKLSIFEHFRGNGRTHNEVLDPEGLEPEAGLIEFVGPNRKIKDLPEVAIIHLGRLAIEDLYGVKAEPSPRRN
jgi:hypothetical protein